MIYLNHGATVISDDLVSHDLSIRRAHGTKSSLEVGARAILDFNIVQSIHGECIADVTQVIDVCGRCDSRSDVEQLQFSALHLSTPNMSAQLVARISSGDPSVKYLTERIFSQ